jgi:hypothetical protein
MNGLFTRQQGTCAVHTPPRCFLGFIRTRGLFTRQQGTRGLLAPAFTTTVLVETNETQDHDITVLASLAAFKPFLALFTRPVNDAPTRTLSPPRTGDTLKPPCLRVNGTSKNNNNTRPRHAMQLPADDRFSRRIQAISRTVHPPRQRCAPPGPTLKPPILGTYAASTGL